MKMKNLFLTVMLILSISAVAQQSDSVLLVQQQRIEQIERTLSSQQLSIQRVEMRSRELFNQCQYSTKRLDSLATGLQQESYARGLCDDELQRQISVSSATAKSDNESVALHVLWVVIVGLVLLAAVLLLVIILYRLLRRDEQLSFNKVHEAQRALQEEGARLDAELVALLEKQFAVLQTAPQKTEPDHALALKIADEIVRIETNLSRMDASVKGFKQLSASVRRIKDNFLANGYEIVDMLGKPYKEGMKATVTTSVDETLPEGTSMITQIIKPQINYNGVMIQSAQIVVSQN